MKSSISKWPLFIGLIFMSGKINAQSFIEIRNGFFVKEDKRYFIAGVNLWYAMHLAAETTGDRNRLITELDQLSNLGVNNVRIMTGSEGPDTEPWRVKPAQQSEPGQYAEVLLEGLDFVLKELGKRQMTAVLCLTNFWPWSGGMAQYVAWSDVSLKIPYPPPEENGSWVKYQLFTSGFYSNDTALKWYQEHIQKIVMRRNKYTGLLYTEDPTIMSWELANEPRAILKRSKYRRWISQSAEYIKKLDSNHLVTIGSEGNTSSRWSGNRFLPDHSDPSIDYCTIHIWPENWGWYDPQKPESTYEAAWQKVTAYIEDHLSDAKRLEKPLVIEEFGLARDGASLNPSATTIWRDRFFKEICMKAIGQIRGHAPIGGVNFWAWSGEGRPEEGGSFWEVDRPLCGDPPHEKQGWYSIYSSDFSTHQVISDFAERLRTLDR